MVQIAVGIGMVEAVAHNLRARSWRPSMKRFKNPEHVGDRLLPWCSLTPIALVSRMLGRCSAGSSCQHTFHTSFRLEFLLPAFGGAGSTKGRRPVVIPETDDEERIQRRKRVKWDTKVLDIGIRKMRIRKRKQTKLPEDQSDTENKNSNPGNFDSVPDPVAAGVLETGRLGSRSPKELPHKSSFPATPMGGRLQFGECNNMDERKTRLMARNILKQQPPDVEQQKKKKAKGAHEEAVQEEQAKKKGGKAEDAERDATDGHAEKQADAAPQADRELPSLAGDLKRKRAPRGAARNVKQKTDGETETDPKPADPAEGTAEDDVVDDAAIVRPTDDGQGKDTSAEAADGGMSRRESSRLRMKPVKFREIIPTLGAKLKASEDGKVKGLESQLPVEVQALEEGHITIGRDRISDVYRRRDKKKVVPAKTDKLPVEDQKEAKPPAIEKKEAKSLVVEKKETKPPAKEAKTPVLDKKGEKEIKSSKDLKPSLGEKKEVKVAPLEKKEARPSTQDKKDAKTPAKTPGKDSKQPTGERKDAKTPAFDKKEGRPPPVDRKDSKTPAVEKKGGKSAVADKKDGKSGAAERKDGQVKIAIKVKPPMKAADPAMVDVPLKDSDENGLKTALQVVKRVMKLKEAEPFNAPVNPVALHIPDYFDVINDPMDLGTIREMLEKGRKYQNTEDVLRDVYLVWSNCRKYNNDTDPVVELMQTVETAFIKHWTAAGLQYVPPKKLAAKGSEKAGKSEQHSQKQAKGQVDPKLQADLQPSVERGSTERKPVSDKKAPAPKEPAEESRPSRQRKTSKAVHFEGVTPPKSKKRSAPVEQVMAESMAREQRASPKDISEQILSAEENPKPKVSADAAAALTAASDNGEGKKSSEDKPEEQRGPVDEAADQKATTSKRAERAGIRLSKRQKVGKEANSPRRQEDEQQGPITQSGVESTSAAVAEKDVRVDPLLLEVATATDEVPTNDVTANDVTTEENPGGIGKGEDESVAGTSSEKAEDEKVPSSTNEGEDAKGSIAMSKDADTIMSHVADSEKDDTTVIAATAVIDEAASVAAEMDDEIAVIPGEGKIDIVKADEIATPTNEIGNRDSGSEEIPIAETTEAISAADGEKVSVAVDDQNEDKECVAAVESIVTPVEGQGEEIPVSADGKGDHTATVANDATVAETAAVTEINSEIPSTSEKRTVDKIQVAEDTQDEQVSVAEKKIDDRTESRAGDRSKRVKIKGDRTSKGRDERSHSSSKKGKDHRSHSSDKRKDIRSHSSSKGRDDRKSHSSRDRGTDGQTPKKKDNMADESVPKSKDDKPEAVSLRRRDDKSVAGDSHAKIDTTKSGAPKKEDPKKDDAKKDDTKKDDTSGAPKKDDKSAAPKKDDKSAPLKKDDKSAPPKKDDKSKRINGTQHHREDCPCVVCKGRRRKLAGIANAERKEKRKLLALQEGATKKSKLPIREQKQLLEESQKDGKASTSNDEVDGWEADDHFGELFDGDSSDLSEAENVRFYPASFKVPPRKLSSVVYKMSTTLFGNNPLSLWSKRPLLQFRPAHTPKSPLFHEICSIARSTGS